MSEAQQYYEQERERMRSPGHKNGADAAMMAAHQRYLNEESQRAAQRAAYQRAAGTYHHPQNNPTAAPPYERAGAGAGAHNNVNIDYRQQAHAAQHAHAQAVRAHERAQQQADYEAYYRQLAAHERERALAAHSAYADRQPKQQQPPQVHPSQMHKFYEQQQQQARAPPPPSSAEERAAYERYERAMRQQEAERQAHLAQQHYGHRDNNNAMQPRSPRDHMPPPPPRSPGGPPGMGGGSLPPPPAHAPHQQPPVAAANNAAVPPPPSHAPPPASQKPRSPGDKFSTNRSPRGPPGMSPTSGPPGFEDVTPTGLFPGGTIPRDVQEARAKGRYVSELPGSTGSSPMQQDFPGVVSGGARRDSANTQQSGPNVREQDEEYVKQSKTLAWMLRQRHPGMPMNSEGWMPIDFIVGTDHMKKLKVDVEKLHQIVKECPKQRFEISDDQIRAKSGRNPVAAKNKFTDENNYNQNKEQKHIEDKPRISANEPSPFNRENANAWRPRNPPRSNTMPFVPKENSEQPHGSPVANNNGGGDYSATHQPRGPPGNNFNRASTMSMPNNINPSGRHSLSASGGVTPGGNVTPMQRESVQSIADKDNAWRVGAGRASTSSQLNSQMSFSRQATLTTRASSGHIAVQAEAPSIPAVQGLHGGKRRLTLGECMKAISKEQLYYNTETKEAHYFAMKSVAKKAPEHYVQVKEPQEWFPPEA